MIHILGAGVAGLMLAEALERRAQSWCIYEKESQAGLYASGKNAGIIRTYETDPVMRYFAEASLAYYEHAEPSFLRRGLLLRPWEVDYDQQAPERRRFSHGRFEGFFLPSNGTVEPVVLLQRLTQRKFEYGGIIYGADVTPETRAGRVMGLKASTGVRPIFAEGDMLVLACGEGAIAFSTLLDRPLGLIAHRRTLYEFKNETRYDGPVEWDEESGVYYRPQGDILVATAGEQIPVGFESESEETADTKMPGILARENPRLRTDLLIASRTCKRLMPLDNRPYAGRDSDFENLFWFTGLGGRGISTAPALAEALARLICQEPVEAGLAAVSPARVARDQRDRPKIL